MLPTKTRLWAQPATLILFLFFLIISTSTTGQVLVQDSSFEAGPVNPHWQVSSANNVQVICTVLCGNCGGQCLPRTGNYFLFLGGVAGTEIAKVDQQIFIPNSDRAHLIFYLKIPFIDASSASYFSVQLDSNALFTATISDSVEFRDSYQRVELNISSYADSGFHQLRFYAFQQKINSATNFLVDDVSVDILTGIGSVNIPLSPVQVYPNPSTGKFQIEFSTLLKDQLLYSVYDNTGKRIISENFQPHNQQLEIDLSAFSPGLYHLQVIDKEQVYYSKLIVQ